MMSQPLQGIKVIALEQAVSIPLTTRHLADMGADVVKIERRVGGDFARAYDGLVRGLSTYFVWLNRGKRSLTLDLRHERGREVARALAAQADVFAQNLGPGAAERNGLGPDSLIAANPRLIYCSLNGYGSRGPYKDKKAYDLLLQGETGLINVSGSQNEAAKVGISAVDIAGGMYALTAILTALYEREHTGKGRALSVSLFDAIAEWMQVPYLYSKYTGKPFPRAGQRHNMIVPYGPYSCGVHGSVNLAVQNQSEWERFCSVVLGHADLASDERFSSNQLRVHNRSVLETMIEAAFAELGMREVLRRMEDARIPYGRVRDVHEVISHPQLSLRGRWSNVTTPAGIVQMLRHPIETEGWDSARDSIPDVGEDTDPILRELGISDDEIEDMRRDGAI